MAKARLHADLRRDGKIVIGTLEGGKFNTQHTLEEKGKEVRMQADGLGRRRTRERL